MRLITPDVAASRRRASEPSADRAPDWVGGRHARAAARSDLIAALGADRVSDARARPRPLRLRRQPVPADPPGGRHAPRRERHRQAAAPRARAGGTPLVFRAGGHLAERPVADATRSSSTSAATGSGLGSRTTGPRVRVAARRGARARQPPARPPWAQARPRSGQHRHRLRRRGDRQQLGRDALRRVWPTPTGPCAR